MPCSTVSTRRTLIFTSTRDPSRLMIDIRRSTVNRPRSALRMREKFAAAIPVRPCAPRTLSPLTVERFDDLGGQNCLEQIGIGILVSQVAKNISASLHYLHLFNPRNGPRASDHLPSPFIALRFSSRVLLCHAVIYDNITSIMTEAGNHQ